MVRPSGCVACGAGAEPVAEALSSDSSTSTALFASSLLRGLPYEPCGCASPSLACHHPGTLLLPLHGAVLLAQVRGLRHI